MNSITQNTPSPTLKWGPAASRWVIFALVLLLADWASLIKTALPEHLPIFWLSNGITLAVLLLTKRKDWPTWLGIAFGAATATFLISGNSWITSLGYAFVHTLESAVLAWVFTRLQKNEISFEKLSDVFVLMLITSVGCAITALLGALIPVLVYGAPYWNAWWLWWNEDGTSALLLAPLIIAFWRHGKILQRAPSLWIEMLLVLSTLAIAVWIIFGAGNSILLLVAKPYMVYPWIIWAGLRYKTPGATLSLFVLAIITLGCTIMGLGTFPLGGQTPSEHLTLAYVFIGLSSLTYLLQTAIFTTLQNTQKELKKSESELKAAQQVAHMGSWNWDIKNHSLEWSDEMFHLFGLERNAYNGNLVDIYVQSIHPDDRQKAIDFNRRMLREKTSEPIEYRVIWPDNSTHILWTKVGEIIKGLDGQPAFVGGISQDITDQKQVEEQLAFTQFAIDHSADAAFWMNGDGRFIYVNEASSMALGYSIDELLQMTIFEIDPYLTRQAWQEHWLEKKTGIKTRHQRKDGSVFPVEVQTNYVEYDGILYNCSFVRDISEREAAEAALQASENRYRTLFENSPISIWEEDFTGVKAIFNDLRAAGVQNFRTYFEEHREVVVRCAAAVKIVECNLQSVRFFGYQNKDEINKSLTHYFTEESYNVFKNELTALEEGRLTFESEIPANIDEKPGTILMIYLNVIPGFENTLGKVLVSFTDITERKRAEQKLIKALEENQASLDFLQNILDTSPSFICWEDRSCHFLGCNKAYARQFGLSKPEDIVGKTNWDMPGTVEQIEFYVESDKRIMESGLPEYHIIENGMDAKGNPLWFDTNKIPLHSLTGEVIGILISIQDITTQTMVQNEIQRLNTELEERVEQRTAQLQASNQELESFSYSVSHDLRAPLRSINGFSQIILEEYTDRLDDTGRGYFNQILAASLRMGQLIENLLKLSRITRSGLQLSRVNLTMLACEIFTNLQITNPEREVEFVIPEKMVVHADESLMRVVLDNLIGNAWKFTGKTLNARIELGLIEEDQKKVIFIRDNGAGFDMTYANKLFGTFQRLHSEKDFAGTGIGLALVQRIIRRHGGTIWAEGVVNHGAAFYFTLPHLD